MLEFIFSSAPTNFDTLQTSVGIATRYGMDGPEIESLCGRDFPHPSRPVLGPTQPPVQWVPGLSPEVKRPGRGADHPPPSSAEVEGRVELHICSPSGPPWPVLGGTLPLSLPLQTFAFSEEDWFENFQQEAAILRY